MTDPAADNEASDDTDATSDETADGGTTGSGIAAPADATESITVYSDYVCPFCYLGRQSLARYQTTREEPLAVDWHPYDLRAGKRGPDGEIDPDADDGKDDDYYAQARENVRRLRERYDVEMAQEIATDVDSLPAQVVSVHVRETAPEAWPAFDEAVFEALWRDGRDIGDREVLADLAADVEGIDAGVVETALGDTRLRDRVTDLFEAARRHGVTGVPTFAFDGHAARGAVPPEQLERLVDGT
ncbi:thioredoxin domain-containing protein [Halorubrum sp. CBA1125]|uniref:DsbA family oxidoreductase n=1 Tax=Halorubrum sp. CBA1125 TaxID=2668072 RepID=UPI0012E76F90|nr:DsbA family protein [Halorubrum sp. CBA1125]MUW15071.1 thioredoxin domain-containing protein [Halorubrum sp. CBA1125]